MPASVILPRGASRKLPGWIVLHGITRPGRFHPTLLRFVRALASSRAAVLVPQVPEWKDLRLSPRVHASHRSGPLSPAFAALKAADDGPYGIIGFSFGAPQVMIAAAHEDIAEQLGGAVGFGGLLRHGKHGAIPDDGRARMEGSHTPGTRPDPYGRWIIGGNHLTTMSEYRDAGDVADALWRLAVEAGERRILAWDPSYDILKNELRRQLASEQVHLFDLFAPPSDREPDLTGHEDFAKRLADAVMVSSRLMNPKPFLADIDVHVQLIHGEGDRLIPFTETLRMQAAFPRERTVDTTITAFFSHAEQGGRLSSFRREVREGIKLAVALGRALGIP